MHDHEFQSALEAELTSQYGPMVTGKDLLRLLAYPTQAAFRQALNRNQLPVPVFSIKHRRGKFALVKELARWILINRSAAVSISNPNQGVVMRDP